MKATPGKFPHVSMVVDVDKKKIINVVRTMHIERRKISFAVRCEVQEMILRKCDQIFDVGAPSLWGISRIMF